jgi:hypothetical protein
VFIPDISPAKLLYPFLHNEKYDLESYPDTKANKILQFFLSGKKFLKLCTQVIDVTVNGSILFCNGIYGWVQF